MTPLRDDSGRAWIDVRLRPGVRATWRVRGGDLSGWLRARYYGATKRPLHREAVQTVLDALDAEALAAGETVRTAVRVHVDLPRRVIVDLCDSDWRIVEVTPDGWRVRPAAEIADVRMIRWPGMQALPLPVRRPDAWRALRRLLPVDDAGWILAVSWLLGAVGPHPYPILAVAGEAGAGKSTLCDLIRCVIDPTTVRRRRPPRDERDVYIAASHAHVLGLDNLSGVPDWLSDALCGLATGGGFATRSLYTDEDETLFAGARPILLNGIAAVGHRSDLRDRLLPVTLPEALEDRGALRSEADLRCDYEAIRPGVLAAVLDAVSAALRYWPEVETPRVRMADFARWIAAAERGGATPWPAGTALAVIREARLAGARQAVEDDPWTAAVVSTVDAAGGVWTGTAADLLAATCDRVPVTARGRTWPDTPRAVGSYLRRVAPDLRRGVGVEVEVGVRRGHGSPRIITIRKVCIRPSPSSPASPTASGLCDRGDGHGDDVGDDAPDRLHTVSIPSPSDNESNRTLTPHGDGGDGGDDVLPTVSESELLIVEVDDG